MSATTQRSADAPAARAPKPTLSPLQIAGSALAAATSAVVASFFGVAGTVIGAALASVVTTLSATLYSASLRKTNDRLRDLTTRRTGHSPATPALHSEIPLRTHDLPAALDPRRAPAPSRRLAVRLAAGAAAVFVAAMVIVTGIELIGQRPVSAMITGASSQGTTLGDLAGPHKAAPSSSAPATGTSTSPTAPSTPSSTSAPTTTTSSSTSAPPTSASTTPGSTSPSSSTPQTTAPQDSSLPTP